MCELHPFKMSVEQESASGTVNDTLEDDKSQLIKGLILIAYASIVMNTQMIYELSVDFTHEAAIWLTYLSLISHIILYQKLRYTC